MVRELTPALRRGLALMLHEHQRQLDEHIREVMADLGLDPADGWRFDAQRGVFVQPASGANSRADDSADVQTPDGTPE